MEKLIIEIVQPPYAPVPEIEWSAALLQFIANMTVWGRLPRDYPIPIRSVAGDTIGTARLVVAR